MSAVVLDPGFYGQNIDEQDTTAQLRIGTATYQLTHLWNASRRSYVRACVNYTVGIMGSVRPGSIYGTGSTPLVGALRVAAYQTVGSAISEWACEYTASAIDEVVPYAGQAFDSAYIRFTFIIRGLLKRAANSWILRFFHSNAEMGVLRTIPTQLQADPKAVVYDYGVNYTVELNTTVWQYSTTPTREIIQHRHNMQRRNALRNEIIIARANAIANWESENSELPEVLFVPDEIDHVLTSLNQSD